ncbi:chromate transporter [Trinickia fusca]|uniref:Chromate transporter n=1 Tax=Trinickia fusca TaxID=2419777 RepID=A0A494X9N1_9BURK|nr:chromate transporter [Trinickia fusca]RKP44904.1 chromate transporter [Trinickia fusca]
MPADSSAPAPDPTSSRHSPLAPADLFRAFCEMGLYGFGGVLPWARRILVSRRRWLSDREFAELLAIGQILPGPNICNIAVIIGYRHAGWRGALAALGGLISVPFVIVLTLGALYHRFGGLAAVQGALRGMTAVAAGLVLVTGIKLAQSQPRTVRALVFGLLALGGIGLLHLPLGWTMLVLIPLALFTEWRAQR